MQQNSHIFKTTSLGRHGPVKHWYTYPNIFIASYDILFAFKYAFILCGDYSFKKILYFHNRYAKFTDLQNYITLELTKV